MSEPLKAVGGPPVMLPSRQEEFEAGEGEGGGREVHLLEYWAVVSKRRALVGVVVGVALAAALLASFLMKPMFRATVMLNVERDKGSVLDIGGGAPIIESYSPEFIPTQTRLMKSREIAERVVGRLNLVENGELNPKKSGLARQAAGETKVDAATKLALAVQKRIETTPTRGTNLVELAYTAPSAKLAADVANALADAYIDWNLESKYRIVGQASQFLAAQVEQLKGEIDDREGKLQAYGRQKDIVSTDPQTNVTMQKLESLNKDYATAVSDRVGKEARYYELQTARPEAIAESVSGGLVTQLQNDQLRLERDYSEKLNLFKPEWPAMQQLQAQIEKGRENLRSVVTETVTKAREQAKSEYQMAQRREETLKGVLGQNKAEAMNLNANAVEYNNLRVEVSTKRTLLDALLKRQSETEVMSRLRGSRESNIRVVDRALPPVSRYSPSYRKNLLLALFLGLAGGVGLAFFLEYLDRSIRTAEQVEQILNLPALGAIPAVGAAAGEGYGLGLSRLYGYARYGRGYGYGYGYGQGHGKTKGYGYGYGHAQEKKRKKREKAAAAAAAAVAAVDGEAALPAVPVTPATPVTDAELEEMIELMPHRHPRSVVAEAYRAFRNALLLSRAGGVKTIAVTSALPREGKTATAVNLAVVLGQLGKKVLLIDGDLHKPRLHEAMKLSNRVGVVSILAEGVEAQKAVQVSSVPNVAVITSGPSTPNPSALLTSEAMRGLIDAARRGFDYVVIDTPPVMLVSDAMVMGHDSDGIVLCVKGGVTPREQVVHARDRLWRSNARILGVLINSLPESENPYPGHYSYRGRYGPGYADAYSDQDRGSGLKS